MVKVVFTRNLARHVERPEIEVSGTTVREAMNRVFEEYPPIKTYILDDQERFRQHVVIFLDGQMVYDHLNLSDPLPENGELYVMQALSGG